MYPDVNTKWQGTLRLVRGVGRGDWPNAPPLHCETRTVQLGATEEGAQVLLRLTESTARVSLDLVAFCTTIQSGHLGRVRRTTRS